MSHDLSIRRLTIAEEAQRAAEAFIETGKVQPNPHIGTEHAQAWHSAYCRFIFLLSAENDAEASA